MTSRSFSWLGPVALLMALTAQLTGMVHLGVVRHERCAEHGELVEVAVGRAHNDGHSDGHSDGHGDGDGHSDGHGSINEGAHDRDTVYAATALLDDEDDHCAVAFRVFVGSPDLRGTVNDLQAKTVVVEADGALAAAKAERSIELLAVAPKTSPPIT